MRDGVIKIYFYTMESMNHQDENDKSGVIHTKQNKLLNMFTRLGVVSWILPYIGEFDKWEKFMNTLCKSTRNLWVENLKAFDGLKDYVLRSQVILEKLLKKHGIDDEAQVDEEYTMDWNMIRHQTQVFNMLKEISQNQFKDMKNYKLRRLVINVLSRFTDEGLSDLQYFFKNMSPNSLKILSLDGGMESISKIAD